MRLRRPLIWLVLALQIWFGCLFAPCALAQTATGELRGQVMDPSGAVVADASVVVTTPAGAAITATTNREGVFEVKGLAPGKYGVKIMAPGFQAFEKGDVEIAAGQSQKVNVSLKIEVPEEKVEVSDSSTKVDVNPANNAGMVVLQGKDLEALSDDPDELQSELQALAGPSAGPNGGQIYIDGFTAGQLPPKASIREIRINQNPFSSEYDKLGYGRIEILTKPGTDQFHGQFFVSGNDSAFNSRSPFEHLAAGTQPPGYESTQYSGNIGGPLSKKASFFFNLERRNINDLSVVSAQIVDPTTFQITPFSDSIANPRTRTNVSQRIDYQVTPANTLTARYQYWRNTDNNDVGSGGFNLASLATNSVQAENTLQVTDTQTVSATAINETRFQFIRETSQGNSVNTTPAIFVPGAFSEGGSTSGKSNDTQDRYELQNITYVMRGKHSLKYGGRLRATMLANASNASFNGAYSFGARPDPTVSGCNVSNPPSTCPQISGIQAYQITLKGLAQNMSIAQIQQQGGGASFYSLNFNAVGTAAADVTWVDGALFAQDDWRVRPNVTLSYGLRYETQNDLGDHADFAPRVGLAWGIDGNGKNKSPKTVLRVGYGIFYDRFTSDLVLQQELHNGVIQQQYLVPNPAFFNPTQAVLPPFSSSTTSPVTIYKPNPNLRSPYVLQVGVSLERQVTKYANLSITYLNSRGVHQFFTNFLNANPVGQAPPEQILYQYQSGAIFKQNQLIVNSSVRKGSISLFGYYTLNYANSDSAGASSIPSTRFATCATGPACPLDVTQDYGRASFDVRHRVFFGGTVGLPRGFRLSPFMVASSGVPFNITTGQDLYGNAVFNARPSAATCPTSPTAGVVQTVYGCFNLTPLPGQPLVPINDATSPGRFTLNLRFSKTFGFGQKKEATATGPSGPGSGGTFGRGMGGPRGGGERGGGRGGFFDSSASNARYSLTFSVNARNLLNNADLGTPIGNLSSPLFGHANLPALGPYNTASANRRIDLQLQFSF